MKPDPPSVVLANRDIITIKWEHPELDPDGGSSVLGFKFYMKGESDTEYTLVQDGWEDPTLLTYTTRLDQAGNDIAQSIYSFRVSALNRVGVSD